MKLPTDLLTDLATLDAALDEPGHLAERLSAVVEALVESVPSLMAVSITVTIDGYPLTLNPTPAADLNDARASIAMTLSGNETDSVTSRLQAHATDPSAFADLRIDAIHALGIHPDQIVAVDDASDAPAGLTLDELSAINQAIGVLIDKGHTIDEAHSELRRRAASAEHPLRLYAQRMITASGDKLDTQDS